MIVVVWMLSDFIFFLDATLGQIWQNHHCWKSEILHAMPVSLALGWCSLRSTSCEAWPFHCDVNPARHIFHVFREVSQVSQVSQVGSHHPRILPSQIAWEKPIRFMEPSPASQQQPGLLICAPRECLGTIWPDFSDLDSKLYGLVPKNHWGITMLHVKAHVW